MRYYSKEHEWLDVDGDTGKVGVTDYAQRQLGDVVYCEAEPAGTVLTAGETAGAVESVKAASDIMAPVSGEILAVNETPQDDPSLLNTAAEETWLFTVRLSDLSELDLLMDAEAYKAYCHE